MGVKDYVRLFRERVAPITGSGNGVIDSGRYEYDRMNRGRDIDGMEEEGSGESEEGWEEDLRGVGGGGVGLGRRDGGGCGGFGDGGFESSSSEESSVMEQEEEGIWDEEEESGEIGEEGGSREVVVAGPVTGGGGTMLMKSPQAMSPVFGMDEDAREGKALNMSQIGGRNSLEMPGSRLLGRKVGRVRKVEDENDIRKRLMAVAERGRQGRNAGLDVYDSGNDYPGVGGRLEGVGSRERRARRIDRVRVSRGVFASGVDGSPMSAREGSMPLIGGVDYVRDPIRNELDNVGRIIRDDSDNEEMNGGPQLRKEKSWNKLRRKSGEWGRKLMVRQKSMGDVEEDAEFGHHENYDDEDELGRERGTTWRKLRRKSGEWVRKASSRRGKSAPPVRDVYTSNEDNDGYSEEGTRVNDVGAIPTGQLRREKSLIRLRRKSGEWLGRVKRKSRSSRSGDSELREWRIGEDDEMYRRNGAIQENVNERSLTVLENNSGEPSHWGRQRLQESHNRTLTDDQDSIDEDFREGRNRRPLDIPPDFDKRRTRNEAAIRSNEGNQGVHWERLRAMAGRKKEMPGESKSMGGSASGHAGGIRRKGVVLRGGSLTTTVVHSERSGERNQASEADGDIPEQRFDKGSTSPCVANVDVVDPRKKAEHPPGSFHREQGDVLGGKPGTNLLRSTQELEVRQKEDCVTTNAASFPGDTRSGGSRRHLPRDKSEIGIIGEIQESSEVKRKSAMQPVVESATLQERRNKDMSFGGRSADKGRDSHTSYQAQVLNAHEKLSFGSEDTVGKKKKGESRQTKMDLATIECETNTLPVAPSSTQVQKSTGIEKEPSSPASMSDKKGARDISLTRAEYEDEANLSTLAHQGSNLVVQNSSGHTTRKQEKGQKRGLLKILGHSSRGQGGLLKGKRKKEHTPQPLHNGLKDEDQEASRERLARLLRLSGGVPAIDVKEEKYQAQKQEVDPLALPQFQATIGQLDGSHDDQDAQAISEQPEDALCRDIILSTETDGVHASKEQIENVLGGEAPLCTEDEELNMIDEPSESTDHRSSGYVSLHSVGHRSDPSTEDGSKSKDEGSHHLKDRLRNMFRGSRDYDKDTVSAGASDTHAQTENLKDTDIEKPGTVDDGDDGKPKSRGNSEHDSLTGSHASSHTHGHSLHRLSFHSRSSRGSESEKSHRSHRAHLMSKLHLHQDEKVKTKVEEKRESVVDDDGVVWNNPKAADSELDVKEKGVRGLKLKLKALKEKVIGDSSSDSEDESNNADKVNTLQNLKGKIMHRVGDRATWDGDGLGGGCQNSEMDDTALEVRADMGGIGGEEEYVAVGEKVVGSSGPSRVNDGCVSFDVPEDWTATRVDEGFALAKGNAVGYVWAVESKAVASILLQKGRLALPTTVNFASSPVFVSKHVLSVDYHCCGYVSRAIARFEFGFARGATVVALAIPADW